MCSFFQSRWWHDLPCMFLSALWHINSLCEWCIDAHKQSIKLQMPHQSWCDEVQTWKKSQQQLIAILFFCWQKSSLWVTPKIFSCTANICDETKAITAATVQLASREHPPHQHMWLSRSSWQWSTLTWNLFSHGSVFNCHRHLKLAATHCLCQCECVLILNVQGEPKSVHKLVHAFQAVAQKDCKKISPWKGPQLWTV